MKHSFSGYTILASACAVAGICLSAFLVPSARIAGVNEAHASFQPAGPTDAEAMDYLARFDTAEQFSFHSYFRVIAKHPEWIAGMEPSLLVALAREKGTYRSYGATKLIGAPPPENFAAIRDQLPVILSEAKTYDEIALLGRAAYRGTPHADVYEHLYFSTRRAQDNIKAEVLMGLCRVADLSPSVRAAIFEDFEAADEEGDSQMLRRAYHLTLKRLDIGVEEALIPAYATRDVKDFELYSQPLSPDADRGLLCGVSLLGTGSAGGNGPLLQFPSPG